MFKNGKIFFSKNEKGGNGLLWEEKRCTLEVNMRNYWWKIAD